MPAWPGRRMLAVSTFLSHFAMSLHALRPKLAALLASLTLAACGGGGSSAPAPTDVVVDPGDGQVTVKWTATPGVEYWMAYAAASSVSTDSGNPHIWARNSDGSVSLISPYVLTGLTNGTTYSFSINGRTDSGPGGAGSPSIAVTPRPGGSTWTMGSTAMGSGALRSVAYSRIASISGTSTIYTPTYLAVGDANALYKSNDGKSWTQINGATGDFRSGAYLNTTVGFVVVGGGGVVYYSTDLASWNAGSSGTSQTFNAVASNGAVVVAVGDSGTIRYSSDGATWTAASSVPTTQALYGVSYSSAGLWLAVGANGTLLTSSDGSTWTDKSSATGTTQTLRSVASTLLTSVTAVTSGVYSYAIVGDAGTVLTSTDGVAWKAASSVTTANLTALVGSASQFLAVGSGGAVITSADGATWTARTTAPDTGSGIDAQGLVFAPSPQAQYIAVGANGANANSH